MSDRLDKKRPSHDMSVTARNPFSTRERVSWFLELLAAGTDYMMRRGVSSASMACGISRITGVDTDVSQ